MGVVVIKVGKHLFIRKIESNKFNVENRRGLLLGKISYNVKWRRFIYEPEIGTYYSSGCGIPLFEFIKKLDIGEY